MGKSAARSIGSELGRQVLRGILGSVLAASVVEHPGVPQWGVALAIVGTLVFSFRPILVKLVYVTYPVSPVTLLFLRMTISLPFFSDRGLVAAPPEPR